MLFQAIFYHGGEDQQKTFTTFSSPLADPWVDLGALLGTVTLSAKCLNALQPLPSPACRVYRQTCHWHPSHRARAWVWLRTAFMHSQWGACVTNPIPDLIAEEKERGRIKGWFALSTGSSLICHEAELPRWVAHFGEQQFQKCLDLLQKACDTGVQMPCRNAVAIALHRSSN